MISVLRSSKQKSLVGLINQIKSLYFVAIKNCVLINIIVWFTSEKSNRWLGLNFITNRQLNKKPAHQLMASNNISQLVHFCMQTSKAYTLVRCAKSAPSHLFPPSLLLIVWFIFLWNARYNRSQWCQYARAARSSFLSTSAYVIIPAPTGLVYIKPL